MAFEQATIRVEKQQEFAKLQAAVEQAFLPEKVERFLKQLDRKGIRVREFDAVLSARVLEDAVGGSAAKSDLSAWQLYQALPLSDQRPQNRFPLRFRGTGHGHLFLSFAGSVLEPRQSHGINPLRSIKTPSHSVPLQFSDPKVHSE